MTLRALVLIAVAMLGAGLGILTVGLCRAAADPDRTIPDNSGYPGTPSASRQAHPSRQDKP